MPGKVGVKIKAGRNLPIMDRSSETTDAYVEIKLGGVTHKTDVCRKSLNPQWNTDWFRFEVDDAELQDEPLQIRLMDHDTYSANDAIGKVNISLNPLCLETASQSTTGKGAVLSGWIPVFDTMHGIRGEVNIIVKVDLFSDVNKFRQSSCGIQFFHSSCVPHGYRAQIIHGFVEELVVNDDPEYQWIDKIRTPRASNEARQVVFLRLSGQVQRKIGLKAINLGANAVIGYNQCFDLEGDVGVVARGIGTAVTLIKIPEHNAQTLADNTLIEESSTEVVSSSSTAAAASGGSSAPAGIPVLDKRASPVCRTMASSGGHIRHDSTSSKMSPSPSKTVGISSTGAAAAAAATQTTSGAKDIEICRRSSDSDLSVTPKVYGRKRNSICVPSERLIAATASMRLNAGVNIKSNPENLDMLEYPFLTLTKYPTGFILHLGATVAARSVKLLERVPNPDEPETRDSWWTELRMEIRSHARALGCNVVLGYSEATTISDDVCVLSATGTAAVINMLYNRTASQIELTGVKPPAMSTSLEERDILKEVKHLVDPSSASKDIMSTSYGVTPKNSLLSQLTSPKLACTMCHVPYSLASVPFNVKMKRCAVCRKGRVPDVLMATVEIPDSLLVTGRGCFMQAQVVRAKKDLRSESNAKEISDGLPFLEYELHRVLINKLKAKGMNAIFGLKAQVSIGERMIALIATGTAIFLKALPPPSVPKIVAGNSWTDKAKLNELQKNLQETYERNREIYQLKSMDPDYEPSARCQSDTDESDDEILEMDLNTGNKDACVLEVDDIEDLEIISLLMEPSPPSGFHVVNTQTVPGLNDMEIVRNLQFFTQVWRAKLGHNQGVNGLANHFQRLCQTIFFKLRSMMPCAICDLRFLLDLPESDEIQLLVTGMALGLGEVNKFKNRRKTINNDGAVNVNGSIKKSHDEELIFPLDEDQAVETPTPVPSTPVPSSLYGNYSLKYRKGSPSSVKMNASRSMKHYPIRERFGIDITPLTYVPGGKIEKYLGNLNFFFIRESTSVREIGGISGFVHSFITELLAVVRAHITTLGGNAMVAFYMTELILVDNQHKNQAQCLVSIGGDVVHVSYHTDD
ncbi:C2 domain-containing protein 5 isoform X3 [Episyrphus balteatus]|uniref:C2 domain-containing protein 5 isoform X3 n=1 Tax=Episyrphus balteatus TaxID=286459 RepID=UPI0024860BDB|nr:C2 domain-containing protein 5 isoform X3 [Episyrphus balteatus]